MMGESWLALLQGEEEFLVLDVSNDFIEELDVLVKNIISGLSRSTQMQEH